SGTTVADPNEPNPSLGRDLLRRRHRDHRSFGRASEADPAPLDDIPAADRQGLGQAAGGDPGAIKRRSSRSRPAAPCARWADAQDPAEPYNVRSALRWLAREKGIPRHGAPLTPGWEGLRAEIKHRFVR